MLLTGAASAAPLSVDITAIVQHPALDAVREGVKKGLADAGMKEGTDVTFAFESAQGSPATAAQIARKFVGESPAAIVAISTPSAQAAAAATKSVPIVFSAVTDPAGAQLVKSVEKPGGNVTGVSDMLPVKDQVALIHEITPDVKRVGFIYNPGEANSVSSLKAFKEAAAASGLSVVEGPATRSADVQATVRSLVGKVDALYVPTDNTIVSAFEGAVSVANSAKLPFYAADTDTVKRGALAAVGFNYFDVGVETGQVVAKILKGEKAGEIPVVFAKGTDLQVNKTTAAKIGLTIPEAVLGRAKVVE
nr:ABC transporter substrate-binding protein [Faunimonas pinastri]